MKHFFLQKKVLLAKNREPEYAQLNTPIDYRFENCLKSHSLLRTGDAVYGTVELGLLWNSVIRIQQNNSLPRHGMPSVV